MHNKRGHILGVDYGQKRIGLSVSDETKLIASPYGRLEAEKKMEKTAQKLIAKMNEISVEKPIESIVIGLPYKMSGEGGSMVEEVQQFIHALSKLTDIPIVTWDERLTSKMAEKALMESGMNRKKRTKYVDTISATLVLQSFLDHRRNV